MKENKFVIARKEKRPKRGKSIYSTNDGDFVLTISHYHTRRRCLKRLKDVKFSISRDITLTNKEGEMLRKCGIEAHAK